MKNKIVKIDENLTIILIKYKNNTYECYIDTEDLDKVSKINGTWHLNINRNGSIDGVRTKIQINGVRKQYWLHNFILKKENKYNVIDHIDHNVLNNRKNNLREITPKENTSNTQIKKIKNASGYRNIYIERGKFRVRINNISFGIYETLEEAILVADIERKKIFPLVSDLNNKVLPQVMGGDGATPFLNLK